MAKLTVPFAQPGGFSCLNFAREKDDQDEDFFWLLRATREHWSVDLFKTDAGEIAHAPNSD
jgi:hypothetical protein